MQGSRIDCEFDLLVARSVAGLSQQGVTVMPMITAGAQSLMDRKCGIEDEARGKAPPPPEDESEIAMRIAIGVSYDGRGFEGWQSQPSGRTVQDHLEAALGQIAAVPVRVNGAGRTDTGVHALGQVAHFDCEASRPESAWVRGANAVLPDAIAVQWAMPISDEFNARFSAIARRYVYLLYVHPVRPSVLAGKAGWYHAPLDLDAMRGAAAMLVGQHDFSAFRSSQCQAKTPVRNLTRFVIRALGPYVIFEVTADAFLHHMVRNLVGCLLYVGKGAQPVAWIEQILAGRDRKRAAPTISAGGLYLAEVRYEDRWKLPGFPRMMPQLGND